MHSRTLLLAATLGWMACARNVPAPTAAPTTPRSVRLVVDTPPQETETLDKVREDVEVDTDEGERTPRVVTFGETPVLQRDGMRARLYGDAKGTLGISVDNFLLFEVTDAKGQVKRRAVVGFTESVHLGNEQVDNVGRRAFTFEPGEVDLTEFLPESEPFKVRTTVLDTWGVGRVSDVYLVLSAPEPRAVEDDLRGE
ncbi:hypothetical protein OWM54_31185 [Myxococcus sp. MISCRS1]|jgi:hypothetical protein|uniref:hypothetical protein n=1 Tax=Myxococcus TaxID=32 RepID=UPI0011419ED1|nr:MULTISPECIES: hypothetical protein [unclassified Myxococcus]MBZ4394656.1 hypothetical protein [Myxococcus sp. AS-1-15]MCY1001627.1 hypothetical protein [Myxococcus sp. MISCRS1]BDT36801.1 lipoprotein [Myxococcus sp. MH1]